MWRVLVLLALSAVTLAAQIAPLPDVGAVQFFPPPRDVAGPARGTGTIRGRVVAADTGQPLRRARVTLANLLSPFPPFEKTVPRTLTDDDGRFALTNIAAGSYSVTAYKSGYTSTTFGARRPSSPPIRIDVANGATIDGIDLGLQKGGVIFGRIVDDLGDPIELASNHRGVRAAKRAGCSRPAPFKEFVRR